jgi:hypothetical protein
MPSSLDNGFKFKNQAGLVRLRRHHILKADSSHKKRRVHYPKMTPLSPKDWLCPHRLAAMAMPIRGVKVEMDFDQLFGHIIELRLLGG